jgi:hypothetical protein
MSDPTTEPQINFFGNPPIYYTRYASGPGEAVEANQPLTFRWTEQNSGVDSGAYYDTVSIASGASQDLQLDGLAASAAATREVTFSDGLPAGTYDVTITIHANAPIAPAFTQQLLTITVQ